MTDRPHELPEGLVHLRTTPEFDERSVPAGLLAAHRVATGVWGRLRVLSGSLVFRFESDDEGRRLVAGDTQTIPPSDPHHLEMTGSVRFVVEFHGQP